MSAKDSMLVLLAGCVSYVQSLDWMAIATGILIFLSIVHKGQQIYVSYRNRSVSEDNGS